jgi:diaminopimelate epimerase
MSAATKPSATKPAEAKPSAGETPRTKIAFTKMNGLGNDVMIVEWPAGHVAPPPDIVRRWGDRRRGVGFDQLLLFAAARDAGEASYRVFNADGGEVQQCGNGVRCLARLLAPRLGNELTLVSPAGRIAAKVLSAERVSVDLGIPSFAPAALPFTTPEQKDRYALQLDTQAVEFGAVSMGNPHIVIEVDSVERASVGILGPKLERHPSFPQGVNVGFMQRESDRRIQLRVFERGAGETLACGTGAAAAVAVGRLWGRLGENVEVSLPGGILEVRWPGPGSALWQTGPTAAVYEGHIEL